jgi:hypothetical protein
MSANFVEDLVCEYYRMRGYLVMQNYWFPVQTERRRNQNGVDQKYSARSWSDIDVLAIGPQEILIIQVKAIINGMHVAEKVETFFDQAFMFLEQGIAPDNKNPIAWWCDGRALKRLLVYEYYSPPSYTNRLRDAGIEVREFSDIFKEIVGYVRLKAGVKEESTLMRMIHFLNAKNYLALPDK